jgi:hypothetical protein
MNEREAEYLKRAQEVEAMAAAIKWKADAEAMREIARRWRALAASVRAGQGPADPSDPDSSF